MGKALRTVSRRADGLCSFAVSEMPRGKVRLVFCEVMFYKYGNAAMTDVWVIFLGAFLLSDLDR